FCVFHSLQTRIYTKESPLKRDLRGKFKITAIALPRSGLVQTYFGYKETYFCNRSTYFGHKETYFGDKETYFEHKEANLR
ncbi:MAG: hypothetical protein ACM3SY_09375, partial [Candidatus Omnitrophota bacterium]